MPARCLIALAASAALAGCAEMGSFGRSTSLPTGGLAIHLDAGQRVVLNKYGIACAEPAGDGKAAGAPHASGLSPAEAAALALQAPSAALLRDFLYRVCEASYNQVLLPFEVTHLLQRSQDMIFGLLAIESLSAALARQAPVGLHAGAAANVARTQAALEAAKNIEQARRRSLEEARAQADKSGSALAREQLELAQASYARAQRAAAVIEANFNAALAAASGAAESRSFLNAEHAGAPKEAIAHLAEATRHIVATLGAKGYLSDMCVLLMNRYAYETDAETRKALDALNAQCRAVVDTYRRAVPPEPAPKPPAPEPGFAFPPHASSGAVQRT